MKRYLLISSLALTLAACSSNEQIESEVVVEDVIDPAVEEAEKREAEKIKKQREADLAEVEYLNNIATHMKNSIAEGDYEAAISLYKNNVLNSVSVEPNGETQALFNEASRLNGDSVSTNAKTDNSNTNEYKVDPRTVHEYMQNQFDVITNYGENYVPEIHDPLVTQKAADAFNLTYEEVERLDYIGGSY